MKTYPDLLRRWHQSLFTSCTTHTMRKSETSSTVWPHSNPTLSSLSSSNGCIWTCSLWIRRTGKIVYRFELYKFSIPNLFTHKVSNSNPGIVYLCMNFCNVLSVATLRCVNVFQQGRWNGPQLRCLNLTLEQTLPWGLRRSRHSQHKALSAPAYTFIIFGYRVASFAKHDGTLYKSPMTNWVKGKGMKRIFRKWK